MTRIERIAVLLLSVLLVFGLSGAASAEESSVVYKGHNIFGFGPGSEFTDTDLFDGFKDVMPGDVLTETVKVSNTASCCDFVKIYMRAEVIGENNPLNANVAEHESVASMQDFLSQLSMTVWNGDAKIYEASPDETDGLSANVLLGTFRRNKGATLTVRLEVPAELDDAYARRVGEVDWVFVVEEYSDADPDIPQTGDHSPIFIYIMLMAVSAIAILLLLKRRRKDT